MRILVAGGAGFIGSRMATRLADSYGRENVVVLDNLTRRGGELNLPILATHGITFVHGDIRCVEDLGDPLLRADTIIDCSAEPSFLAGYKASQRVVQNNLVGTINLLECARQWKSRFVFLSTSRVYPIEQLCRLPLNETEDAFRFDDHVQLTGVSRFGIDEDFPLNGYRSIYGATKLAGELLVEEYRHAFGLSTIVNRCGVVTGPGQMARADQGVFALWMAAHIYRRPLKYIGFGGTGKQVRDLLHVDDLIDLVKLQLCRLDELSGALFNVGGGESRAMSLLQTTRLCEEIAGRRITIEPHVDNRTGDIPWFVTDARKAAAELGWSPKRSVRETLEDISRWIIDNREVLRGVLE